MRQRVLKLPNIAARQGLRVAGLTVSSDGRFQVGQRLKEEFENGRSYYAMHGQSVSLPRDPRSRPSREALEWHQANKFLG